MSGDLISKIQKRRSAITDLMIEKELLILTYVFEKVPKPYYIRWKHDANDAFSLLVAVQRRQKRLAKNKANKD